MINSLNNEKKREELKCEIADIFMGISRKDNANSSHVAENKLNTLEEEFNCKISNDLELISIWFQSILRLELSPSAGNADCKKMSEVSIEKFIDKVNEFHNFLSKNENFQGLIKKAISNYQKKIEKDFEAFKVLENFKNVSHSNLNKLKLILSDFKIFLSEKGIYPENNKMDKNKYHRNLKLMDSLLKLLILLHRPIRSVYNLFD
ncbi:MAG: hypothetical protein EU548_04035 [Promethearchaeota archaeon]|nr:MAG: hypothetical protein EU548_04035 [Candidatus Lokiarchaeota archaeon]